MMLNTRLRRLRRHPNLRALVRETQLSVCDFVLPLFVREGITEKQAIVSLPGHYQLSLDDLPKEIDTIQALGIPAVLLFGIPSHKDAFGTSSYQDNGIIQQAIARIKQQAPDLLVIADNCFCQYTDHGHCGVLNKNAYVDNDATLDLLSQQALSYAKAGVDMLAPSGMLDGMVKAIRHTLDHANYYDLAILSYAVKYCSAFYGPFREAAKGAPKSGDRRHYQMDPSNAMEALREAECDIQEGADILMVKPALNYLDIIARIKHHYPHIPLAAYQVSGEYAMLKAAAERGWLKECDAVLESLLAIKRAGASFIVTYYAKEAAKWLLDASL